jgi:hypothetical protein
MAAVAEREVRTDSIVETRYLCIKVLRLLLGRWPQVDGGDYKAMRPRVLAAMANEARREMNPRKYAKVERISRFGLRRGNAGPL